MDINYLAELVVKKYNNKKGYAEMSSDDMYKSVFNYLTAFYKQRIQVSNLRLDMKRRNGEKISETDYQDALSKAQSITIKQAYAIAATDVKDLEDLKGMN